MRSSGNIFRKNKILRTVAGLAAAALVLAAFGWLVTGPLREYPAVFDASIRRSIRQMQSPMWTSLFLAVTNLGSTLYLTVIGCAAGVVFLMLRWFRPVLLLIVVMAGQAILHHGFKWVIARPRPSSLISYREVESLSFPSGHAIAALCLYGTIAWIVSGSIDNPAAKAGIWIFTIVLVFLVGMSRVYIGIHYPTDVLAGFIAAAIWTVAVASTDRRAP